MQQHLMLLSAHRDEDDGCQFVEEAVIGLALSTRSCRGQTYVGAVSPRNTDQQHGDAMGEALCI